MRNKTGENIPGTSLLLDAEEDVICDGAKPHCPPCRHSKPHKQEKTIVFRGISGNCIEEGRCGPKTNRVMCVPHRRRKVGITNN